jgi:hypothetical protein
MRTLVPLLLAVIMSASQGSTQTRNPGTLVGRWSGTGTFFNADLQKKVGSLPFVLHLAPDRTGTGSVGGVPLRDVRVLPTGRYLEVRAKLARPVASDPAVAKDRLVIVVTALSDSTANAEFHLKTNFVYDLRMREGRVVLTRLP